MFPTQAYPGVVARANSILTVIGCVAVAGCASTLTDQEKLEALTLRLRERGVVARVEEPPAAVLERLGIENGRHLEELDRAAGELGARAEAMGERTGADPDARYLDPLVTEELRLVAFDYLQVTRQLARIADDHARVEDIASLSPRLRAEALALRLASALSGLELTGRVVDAFHERKLAREVLNQPHERDHLPARLYERIAHARRGLRLRARIRGMIDAFQDAEMQRAVLDAPEASPLPVLARRIYDSPLFDELRKDESLSRIVLRGGEKVVYAAGAGAHEAGQAVYPLQVFVASIIGDLETSSRAPYLDAEDGAVLERRLRPGDILLRRCDFFVSNAFLPGWWGHAAIYTGTAEDLRTLGLDRDPRVAPHLERVAEGNHLVEAVGEGVRVYSIDHFMEADHVAALRPRWKSVAERNEVVARAFADVGKAYDFQFDFTTDDVVVCSEVVYRAYAGTLDFQLKGRFGRFTLTPDDVAEKAVGEDAPLRLVYFFKDGKVAPPSAFEAMLK